MHSHADEIRYWAEHPDGTGAWFREYNDTEWYLDKYPKWNAKGIYIVDNEFSELRKAQADGKQLQRVDFFNSPHQSWTDMELTVNNIESTLPEHWRTKPEPVYEWQWHYKIGDLPFRLTDVHYATKDDVAKELSIYTDLNVEVLDKYEPSKREIG